MTRGDLVGLRLAWLSLLHINNILVKFRQRRFSIPSCNDVDDRAHSQIGDMDGNHALQFEFVCFICNPPDKCRSIGMWRGKYVDLVKERQRHNQANRCSVLATVGFATRPCLCVWFFSTRFYVASAWHLGYPEVACFFTQVYPWSKPWPVSPFWAGSIGTQWDSGSNAEARNLHQRGKAGAMLQYGDQGTIFIHSGLNDSLLDDYIMRVMTTFLAVSASPAILNSTDVSLAKSRWNAPMLYKHAANKYTTWASSQLVRKGESQRGEFDYYIECESSYKRVPKVRQETKGK